MGQALVEVTLCPVTLPTGITAEEPVHLSSIHQVPTGCQDLRKDQRITYILEFDQPSA